MGIDPSNLGVNTNFFEVGGDSLLVIKLISQLRQNYNMTVGVADFLHHPTISDFARAIPSSSVVPTHDPSSAMAPPQLRPQRIASLLPRRKTVHKGRSPSVASRGDGSPRTPDDGSFRSRTPSAIDKDTRGRTTSSFIHTEERMRSGTVVSPEEYRARTPSGYEGRGRTLSVAGPGEAEPHRVRIPSAHERREELAIPMRARALSSVDVPPTFSQISPRGEPPKSPKFSALDPFKLPRTHHPVIPQLALEDIIISDSPIDSTRKTSPDLRDMRSESDGSHDSSSGFGLLRNGNNSQSGPAPPSPDHALCTKQASILAAGAGKTPGSPGSSRLLKRKPSRTISVMQLEDINSNTQVFTKPLSFLFLRQLIAVFILVLPIVSAFVGSYIGVRILTDYFDINSYFLVPLVYPAGGIVSTLGFIPYKWIWIGRYKHCVMRLWSWKFMVWWALDRYRFVYYLLIFSLVTY